MWTTLSTDAINNIYLVFGLVSGGMLTWMYNSANARWRRGRGLRRVPAKVERENIERMWQAQSDKAQGCREMLRAIGEWSMVVVIVFLLGLFLGG